MHKRLITLLLCLLLFCNVGNAKSIITPDDSLSVSLLTVSAGEQIYELFGHTGIRVKIPSKDFDGVFHYGLFSFEAPNFVYRFVKGETDYSIGLIPFLDFMTMYAIRGSRVEEMQLNLTQTESRRLFDALWINLNPQNRDYRYSFLYDNCATRPLNIITNQIDGNVNYMLDNYPITFREMIHSCTVNNPWTTFGIDLLLDGEVDRQVSLSQTPFLPQVTEHLLQNAIIENGDTLRKFVTIQPKVILQPNEKNIEKSHTSCIMPIWVFSILLVLIIALSYIEISFKQNHIKVLDTILYIAYGTMGLVILFLLIFSEHPAVSANFNIVWLHPLWLLIIPIMWIRRAKKFLYCFHFINFALLIIFLMILPILPQYLSSASIPLIAILIVRSFTYIQVERGCITK